MRSPLRKLLLAADEVPLLTPGEIWLTGLVYLWKNFCTQYYNKGVQLQYIVISSSTVYNNESSQLLNSENNSCTVKLRVIVVDVRGKKTSTLYTT